MQWLLRDRQSFLRYSARNAAQARRHFAAPKVKEVRRHARNIVRGITPSINS